MADIPVEPRRRTPAALLLIVLLVAVVAALALWYFTRDAGGAPADDVETEVSEETTGPAGDQ